MIVNARFFFDSNYREDTEKPTLELAATDDEPNTATVFEGKIKIPKDMVYEIMRAAREEGKKPLLILEIVD